jgi:hypothetical protein
MNLKSEISVKRWPNSRPGVATDAIDRHGLKQAMIVDGFERDLAPAVTQPTVEA